jgi:ATP-dependent DNA ligase
MSPAFQLLPVVRKPRRFNGSDWLFELKYDGFRASHGYFHPSDMTPQFVH